MQLRLPCFEDNCKQSIHARLLTGLLGYHAETTKICLKLAKDWTEALKFNTFLVKFRNSANTEVTNPAGILM